MRRLHLLVAAASAVYDGTWVSQPSMSVERYGAAVAVVAPAATAMFGIIITEGLYFPKFQLFGRV